MKILALELDFATDSTKQYLWRAGWAWNSPGAVVARKRKTWRSVAVPDLFGPVWVWKRLR